MGLFNLTAPHRGLVALTFPRLKSPTELANLLQNRQLRRRFAIDLPPRFMEPNPEYSKKLQKFVTKQS